MADKTIGEFGSAPSPLLSSDLMPMSRDGLNTLKMTFAELMTFIDTYFSLGALASGDDAEDVPFTPAVAGNWATTPTQVKQALDLIAAASSYTFIDDATGARTFGLTDQSLILRPRIIRAQHATANSFTVPPNSSVAFPVGAQLNILHDAAGTLTFVQGAGVTIRVPPNGTLVSLGTGAIHVLIKRATDTWQLIGPTVLA